VQDFLDDLAQREARRVAGAVDGSRPHSSTAASGASRDQEPSEPEPS
jgi:hypothetical protein